MPFDSATFPESSFLFETHRFYNELIESACSASDLAHEPSLGGKLLYAGELDERGRALVVAGNIAGAATLTASIDSVAQKQAIRDGVVDFLVTSLDEALRILKNEIRKRETVAVCVGGSPAEIVREMLERGVDADLLREKVVAELERNAEEETVLEDDSMKAVALTAWSVDSAPARWLPKLDSIATGCLDPGDLCARRWLRLAPRYIGRMSNGWHLLQRDRGFASCFLERVRQHVDAGEIGAEVLIQTSWEGSSAEYRISR